ncbi:MAG: DUF554 domain-containing protein [Eubacteriales bacterium]|nr:DUF554 domain-containing protein [Eubacteriales bacterium]
MGTIINMIAVIAGGILGNLLGGKTIRKYETSLMNALGLCTLYIGASGTLSKMFTISNGVISTSGSMLVIISLIIGTIVGEFFQIELHLEQFGNRIKKAAHADGDSRFIEAFMSNALVICVGAMGIVGSLENGMTGDFSTLTAKAALDFMISLIFASTLGVGAAFAAIPLGIYQGSITLLAHFIAPFMTTAMISDLSMVGSVMITGVGINLIWNKGIRLANMLPAILIPVIYHLLF